jgi:hypothetical protein
LVRTDIAGLPCPLFLADNPARIEISGNAKELAMPQMDDYGRHEVLLMATKK